LFTCLGDAARDDVVHQPGVEIVALNQPSKYLRQ
jgi:hypothetical protein